MTRIIFENACLFDGVSRETPDGMFVLVENDRIVEVSDKPISGSADQIIDCSGKTLMPGMIDAHIHIYVSSTNLHTLRWPSTYNAHYAAKFLKHILSCGFTTVRDIAGGDHGMALALRDGLLEGPRFFYGGLCLSQTGGHGDDRAPEEPTDFCTCAVEYHALARIADGVDDCIKAVRDELRKGAHHIKIMASGGVMSPADPIDRCQYSEAEIRAMVEEATRHGAYLAAHCHPPEAIRRCVEYGVRSIEHGTLIDEETAKLVAEKGAFVVPTMAVIHALKDEGKELGVSQASLEKLDDIFEQAVAGLGVMKAAGVKMGFGTDLLGEQHVRQGTEFAIRARILEPYDILHSATAVNAALLQRERELGCVKPGAYADLLLVDGNPMEDISILAEKGAHIPLIMKGGEFVKNDL